MPVIKIETLIEADIETCFDLSRSIDLHKISTADTNEKAVAGVTSGLICLGETVTWEAKHFGITQQLTSKITQYSRPHHFRDEQQKGAFRYFIHDHYFEHKDDGVLVTDVFNFKAPFGLLGKIVDNMVLKLYMKRLLQRRNIVVKNYAETRLVREILRK